MYLIKIKVFFLYYFINFKFKFRFKIILIDLLEICVTYSKIILTQIVYATVLTYTYIHIKVQWPWKDDRQAPRKRLQRTTTIIKLLSTTLQELLC